MDHTPTEKTLAGQPQDHPWQSYSPPSAETNENFVYPQSGGQGYGQAYAQPAPGYPGPSYGGQDQPFPGQDQGYTRQEQPFPGQDQGYPGPQGQSAPQWQGAYGAHSAAGMSSAAAATAKARGHAKGFIGSLFDFSFSSFVTPKIIKVLYVLITVWTLLWALIFLRFGFKYGGAAGGFFTLIIVDPILVLLTLGAYRVVLELFMVVHQMHDDLKAIRERDDERG